MKPIKPTLRPVKASDQDFLKELFETIPEAAIYAHMPEHLSKQLLQSQFAVKEQAYHQANPCGDSCIVELNRKAVGRLFVNISSDEIRLVDIIIHPSSRGQGIASSLLEQLILDGNARKLPIRLQVAVNNVDAQRLYQRYGFILGYNDGVHIHCEYLPGLDLKA